ncbi:unnamed protein product [Boreogadus saida]
MFLPHVWNLNRDVFESRGKERVESCRPALEEIRRRCWPQCIVGVQGEIRRRCWLQCIVGVQGGIRRRSESGISKLTHRLSLKEQPAKTNKSEQDPPPTYRRRSLSLDCRSAATADSSRDQITSSRKEEIGKEVLEAGLCAEHKLCGDSVIYCTRVCGRVYRSSIP